MRALPQRYIPYWLIFLLLVALLYAASLLIPDGLFSPVHSFGPGEAAKATVDQLNLLSTLMVTLNTSLITGSLAVAVNGHVWNPRWSVMDRLAVLLVLSSGATVYYGVYMAFAVTLEMIAAGFVDPFQRRLALSLSIQYHAFMAGFLMLGIVFCRILEFRLVPPAQAESARGSAGRKLIRRPRV